MLDIRFCSTVIDLYDEIASLVGLEGGGGAVAESPAGAFPAGAVADFFLCFVFA
jgi:hypothetical protein